MSGDLATTKDEFEQLFRRHRKHILVDEVGVFVSGCGCRGVRLRPGGLRTPLLDSYGQEIVNLLVGACADQGVTPNLGYVQMVFGSRDLIESIYMVDACPACRVNVEESDGLAPVAVFYSEAGSEHEV